VTHGDSGRAQPGPAWHYRPADGASTDAAQPVRDGVLGRGNGVRIPARRRRQRGLEEGFGPPDQNIVDGRRQSSADSYLAAAAARPNLNVVTEAIVHRLRLDGDRCSGLDYQTETGETISVSCRREVVLSAGTVGSSKLLMLSGIGPQEHLRELPHGNR
jgi:choline dehydrogenase-like flavoprotein